MEVNWHCDWPQTHVNTRFPPPFSIIIFFLVSTLKYMPNYKIFHRIELKFGYVLNAKLMNKIKNFVQYIINFSVKNRKTIRGFCCWCTHTHHVVVVHLARVFEHHRFYFHNSETSMNIVKWNGKSYVFMISKYIFTRILALICSRWIDNLSEIF